MVKSSSWREDLTIDQLKKIFKWNGLGDNIVGMTPIHGVYEIRGNEIKAYLKETDYEINKYESMMRKKWVN